MSKNRLLKKINGIDISYEFKTVRDINGNEYVFFVGSSLADGFENSLFFDRTSLEAFENHLHLAEKITKNEARQYILSGESVCRGLLSQLEIKYPEKAFAVFLTVKTSDSVILRFHQIWDNEPLYFGNESFPDGTVIFSAKTYKS